MGYWDHSFEEVPCVFCGNKDAIRKLGNLGNYTIRCPACGNFFADISFIDDVAENGVLDSYILSGHARELSDGPPGIRSFSHLLIAFSGQVCVRKSATTRTHR